MDELSRRLEDEAVKRQEREARWLQSEKESMGRINRSLNQARAFLGVGDRKAAVAEFERLHGEVSPATELGGQFHLEYAMALETVDRSEEARQIYGKVAIANWSPKIKGNAVQLLQVVPSDIQTQ
jgi:hypothetical protein